MKHLLFITALIASPTWAICDKLSVTDAATLSQEQLGNRICSYMEITETADQKAEQASRVKDLDTLRVNNRIAEICMNAVVHTGMLYAERFNNAVPTCVEEKMKKAKMR